ncbi:MAG: hypothetical protein CMC70_10580 [Flavobacteriaceae bacterium]|nr:hypothetical protein [Flavobacteriaceae bacterium]
MLDPVELNEDILPAMELYAGEINEHNISETVRGVITQPASATHSYVYKEKMSDPGFGDFSSAWNHPSPGTASGSYVASHKVSNDMNWEVIDLMTFTKATGVSKLWIVGQVTYIWLGFSTFSSASTGHLFSEGDPSDPFNAPAHPAGVQFALRVNGHLIESTITGKRESWAKVTVPARAKDQRSSRRKYPGPDMPDVTETGTMGPHCASVRLGTFYDVLPGTHTIEIVVRRFPPLGQRGHLGTVTYAYGQQSNFVHVFNRKLFTLDVPSHPPNSSPDATISVGTFDSEDTISRESLGAEKIDRMAAAFRSVQTGSLSRGALNHFHLTSPVVAKKQSTISASVYSISNKYPGYNTSTVTTNTSGNGWYLLYNGTEYLNAVAPTVWDITTESIFLVMANVQVKSVRATGSAQKSGHVHDHFAALALGYNNSSTGAVTVLGQTEVYVNHYNSLEKDSSGFVRSLEEEYDVALFAVVKSSDLSAAPNYFGVYGATINGLKGSAGVTDTTLTYHRGNITVIQLKA